MEVLVNWWGIIIATLSTMVVGSVWYTPKVFGNSWMKLIGKKPKDLQEGGAVRPILITLAVSFISAYVLAHVIFLSHDFFQNSWLQDALSTAFWVWLGFTAARFVTHDAFEHRPLKLTVMNISHELVTLLVMGAILGWLHP
jgi:cation transport ATPase